MKKIICILLILVMMLSLTACSGSTGTKADTNNVSDSDSGSKHRDTLTVAVSKEPKSLISYGSNDTGSSYVTSLIYEKLIDTDNEMNLIPCLAKSWEKIDDTHYRFILRDDVTFHNGVKFTAEDVLYTFEQLVASEATSSTIGPVDVANCKIEDEYTIVLALSKAYPAFLRTCSLDIAGIVCKQAMVENSDGYAKNPIGSGAFKFVEWATGDYIKMVANTDWWGGKINFDNLILRYIPEATTRAIEVETGGVDIAQVTADSVESVKENSDIVLLSQPILNTAYISFNSSIEPFNNKKVRQAISLAVDCDAIVKAAYYGLAETSHSFLAPDIWGYYKADSEYDSFNVEKAKELMAEAGYADGFNCTMVSNGNQAVAEMIQAYLAQIGITVELNVTDFSNWLDAIVNGKQQMYIGGWTVPSGDASEAFSAFHSKNFGSGGNRSFYANDEVDALIEKIDTETDEDARYEACKKLQEILADECVSIGLNVGTNFYAYSSSISGFDVLPTQSSKFQYITFEE
jgi:peptide/nickel transport system substrate-binding protein